MAGNDLVSVIIPCYNSEDTIVACVESVRNQTYKTIEVLIIDDGSTDSSSERISSYLKELGQPANIKLVRQENAGPSAARNKGVNIASGDWIAFLDADDYWMPEKLHIQLKCLKEHPDLALIGVQSTTFTDAHSDVLSLLSFEQMLLKNYFKTSGVVLKKSVALEIPFDEKMKYSEDYRAWLIIAARYKVGIVNRALCGSITNKRVFGASGLSANLSAMQQGEISNYRYLYDRKYIGTKKYIVIIGYSYLRYLRRIIITFAN
jgi:glycosyltransferase involved in cell wall biosynthesis